MFHLFYSNRTECLADALARELRRERAREGSNPLTPTSIIVPSRVMAAYLKMALAERLGVAASLRFESLGQFLTRTLEVSDPAIEIAEPGTIESLLLAIFADERALEDPPLAPLRHYLLGQKVSENAVDLRRVQLARRMSRLFEGYAETRPGLLVEWRRPTAIETTGAGSIDSPIDGSIRAWQRNLWLRIFGSKTRWRTAFEALDGIGRERLVLPASVHLFAVPLLGASSARALHRLSRAGEITAYSLNPCEAFWEDVGTKRREPPQEDREDDAPLLRAFGRAGRENVRVLNELSGWSAEHVGSDLHGGLSGNLPDDRRTDRETLLQELQQDLRALRSPTTPPIRRDLARDDSVTFLECPSMRREAEIVAGEIWSSVLRAQEDGQPIRFDEIAVILCAKDHEAYHAHFSRAFRESHDIPHHLLDVELHSTSRVFVAIELLLSLPLGNFTRQEVLRILTHPTVIGRFPEVEFKEWTGWVDALGIVHGADREDHEDTYIESELYHWDQGMKRLVLGAFMGEDPSADTDIFELRNQRYLPEAIALDRTPSAAKLVSLVRSLVADVRLLRSKRGSLSDWAAHLEGLISRMICPQNDQDERDLLSALSMIGELRTFDVGQPNLSFRIAFERVESALASVRSDSHPPFSHGVVVAPIHAVRDLPFEIVFLTGLGEGQFPRADSHDEIDLRVLERKPSDISQGEQDRYLFLEALLCARRRIVISHVSRDPQTGEPIEPSPVVSDLKRILEDRYLGAEGLRQTNSPRSVIPSTAAWRGAEVLTLREHLAHHLGSHKAQHPQHPHHPRELSASLPSSTFGHLGRRLGLPPLPDRPADSSTKTLLGGVLHTSRSVSISSATLRKFLDDPLQCWARFVLGLSEDDRDEDPIAVEDEAFTASRLDATLLLRATFLECLRSGMQDFAPSYDREALRYLLKGRLPTGVFGQVERRNHLRLLGSWTSEVERMLGRPPATAPTVVRFGHSRERGRKVADLLEPIVLEVARENFEDPVNPHDPLRIEIFGQTDPILQELPASLSLRMGPCPSPIDAQRYELHAFFDHLMLAALGRGTTERAHHAWIIFSDKTHQASFLPIREDEARQYLGSLIRDLLFSSHAYQLPASLAFTFGLEGREHDQAWVRSCRVISDRENTFGAIDDPDTYPVPPHDIAREIAARRFGLYFEKRR